jgi:drug/metabolite transporter (DMT)-like permease
MTRRGWTSLGITAALWGASYLFIKVALDDGFSEPFIVFARTALGALVLVPLALRAGAWPAVRRRGWSNVLLASCQVVLPFALITYGERWVESGLAGILVASAPLFVALIALRIDPDERAHGASLLGLVVGIVGVALLFGVDLSGDRQELLGGVMILVASLSYAVAGFVAKRRFTGVPPEGIAASTMVVSAVVALPFAALQPPDHGPSAEAALSLLALGAGGTGIAFLLYYATMRDVGPARASVVAYVAPAFAVLYGVTLLDEALTAGTVAGLALILAGSYLAATGRLPAWLSRSGPSRSSAPVPERVP